MSRPRGLNILLALVGVCASLVTAAFFSAPDLDERVAMERRETLEHARILGVKGDNKGAAAILEPLLSQGPLDRSTARAILANYAATDRMYEHANLVMDPDGVMHVLKVQDLHEIVSLYSARGMPKEARVVAAALDERGAALPRELAYVGRGSIESGDRANALAIARRIASKLHRGREEAAAAFVAGELAHDGSRGEVDAFLGKWMGSRPTLQVFLVISRELVENGRADIVVSALVDRQLESDEARNTYAFAVSKVAMASGDARRQQTPMLLERLNKAKAGTAFEFALADTLAFGDLDLVASELGATGRWRSPEIRPAFTYAMQATGRVITLRGLIVAEAGRPETTVDERRAMAGELARMGFRLDSISILKRAASRQGPNGDAMNDLLYTWNAGGLEPEAAWIGDQARAATTGPIAEAWIGRIASVSPTAAISEIERGGWGARETRFATLRARYVGWSGDSAALRTALAELSGGHVDTESAAELGMLSCQIGDLHTLVLFAQMAGNDSIGDQVHECAAKQLLVAARQAVTRGDRELAESRFAEARRIDGDYIEGQRAILLSEGFAQGVKPSRLRTLAGDLLGMGYAADGIELLKLASSRESPNGRAFGDLLYVWSQNGLPADIAWMSEQARNSIATEGRAEAWLARISQISPEAAVREIDRGGWGDLAANVGVLKVRYLGWRGDSSALRTALAEMPFDGLDQTSISEIGSLSCQIGDITSTVRLASAETGGRKIRECAARLLLNDARTYIAANEPARAEPRFAEARRMDESVITAQDYVDWAGAASTAGAKEGLYEAALESLQHEAEDTVANKIMQAVIYGELKQHREQQRVLEAAMTASPGDPQIRLMLAEAYLAQQDYKKALVAISDSSTKPAKRRRRPAK